MTDTTPTNPKIAAIEEAAERVGLTPAQFVALSVTLTTLDDADEEFARDEEREADLADAWTLEDRLDALGQAGSSDDLTQIDIDCVSSLEIDDEMMAVARSIDCCAVRADLPDTHAEAVAAATLTGREAFDAAEQGLAALGLYADGESDGQWPLRPHDCDVWEALAADPGLVFGVATYRPSRYISTAA